MGQRQTVPALLGAEADERGDDDFVKCGGEWRTRGDIDARARQVAGALRALGVHKGDRVALIVPNRDEMLDLIFGCLMSGAVEVPLNAWLKGEFLRHQLADCGADVLVADDAGLRSAIPLLGSTSIKHVVALDDPDAADATAGVDVHGFGPLVDQAVPWSGPTVGEGDLASIIYTSGTTGLPKGCMLPQRYFLTGAASVLERGWTRRGERLFTSWPLFHTSGQAVALMGALVGQGSLAIEPDFSASVFLERAQAEHAQVLLGVGFMGEAMLAQPESPADREHEIRRAVWIPMAPATQRRFEDRFGIPVLAEGFGQTECFPITMADAEAPRRPGALGTPTDHVEVALVDADDHPVSVGEVGEIVVRPRHPDAMYAGYWGNPEATVKTWRNLWHHTGDLARSDADGNLSFVDRKKDAIRRRGENVSSVEVEVALRGHPSVASVAVYAVPSPLGEDDIMAAVVLAPGSELDPGEVFRFCQANLPYFAIPRYLDVRPSLPLNALGRVMKHALRDEGVTATTWDFEALGLAVPREERRG